MPREQSAAGCHSERVWNLLVEESLFGFHGAASDWNYGFAGAPSFAPRRTIVLAGRKKREGWETGFVRQPWQVIERKKASSRESRTPPTSWSSGAWRRSQSHQESRSPGIPEEVAGLSRVNKVITAFFRPKKVPSNSS
jgi:hypothetical protein